MADFTSRFGAQAAEYRSFRPVWPAEVLRRILERVPAPRRRAIDLGAGTGLVASRLVEDFDEVIAVEPDERMLAQLDPGPERVHARAEDADFARGSADLVTAGNAFHWMEGAAVCARVRAWLRPGGTFAVFRYDPPHAAEGPLRDLLAEEYGVRWREHVHPRLGDPGYTRRTLAESSFGERLEASWIPNDLALSLPELIGFCRSTSYGGGYARSLGAPEGYWRELEQRIRDRAGPGPFRLDFSVELLLSAKD